MSLFRQGYIDKCNTDMRKRQFPKRENFDKIITIKGTTYVHGRCYLERDGDITAGTRQNPDVSQISKRFAGEYAKHILNGDCKGAGTRRGSG